jgi:hypothetical protein
VLGSTSSSSLDVSGLAQSATISISSSGAGEGVFGEVCQGLYTAPADGVCTFTWDNTYSRLRGKQVRGAMTQVGKPWIVKGWVSCAVG